jgi:hypothetical protein
MTMYNLRHHRNKGEVCPFREVYAYAGEYKTDTGDFIIKQMEKCAYFSCDNRCIGRAKIHPVPI